MSNTSQTPLKIVVVGDEKTDKTMLLYGFVQKEDMSPFKNYSPTVFENFDEIYSYQGKTVKLSLWDTSGTEFLSYNSRLLNYQNTKVFVICFSVVDHQTLENVKNIWVEDLKRFDPKIPYILCGTRTELRNDEKVLDDLKSKGLEPISYEDGAQFATDIGAKKYVECSPKNGTGTMNVINQAILVALSFIEMKHKDGGCILH